MVRAMTYPPSQEALVKKALDYLKECQRKEYRELKKSGELAESLKATANQTRRYAENLQEAGVNESQAWNQAIRLLILRTETD